MLLYGQTDIGQIRSSNQDVYQIETLDDNACFGIVCDGMGGENGGQIASAVASQVICEELKRNYKSGLSDDDYKDIIIEAVSDGNVAVYEKAKGNPLYKGMGTTGVFALVVGDKAYIAHVGTAVCICCAMRSCIRLRMITPLFKPCSIREKSPRRKRPDIRRKI